MGSTRAQLVTLLNSKIISGQSNTKAQGLRDYENEIILSELNKIDDLNISGGYLGISSLGRVDISFINAASQTGKFLRDDGSWQTTGASSLASVLAVGNTTSGKDILVSAGDKIDAAVAGGTLDFGVSNAAIINIGNSGSVINFHGTAIYEYVANAYIEDKLVTYNYGGAAGSASGVGFEMVENSVVTGYFKTNGTRASYLMKAPTTYEAEFLLSSLSTDRKYTFPDAAGVLITTGNLSSITATGTVTSGTLSTGAVIAGVTMTLGSDALGDVYYRGTSGVLSRLAAGAAGKFLMFNGVGAAPIVSTLVLPNSATANRVPYATATNTWGDSSAFIYDGTNFTVGSGAIPIRIGVGATSYSSYAAIYFNQSSPSTTNYGFLADASNLWMNATSSLNFMLGDNAKFTLTGSGLHIIGPVFVGSAVTGATASLHIVDSTTAQSQLRLGMAGSAPTSGNILAGNIFGISDKFYATITTGTAVKEFTLNDSALTSGKIPVATTNGRLTDSTASTLVSGGITTIVASTFEKPETGTDANVLTYAVGGGADEFLNVQVAVDVGSLTGGFGSSIVATVTWKDSNNTTATSNLSLTGAGDGIINIPINAYAGSNVVVSTVFVGVSVAYNISSFVVRLK